MDLNEDAPNVTTLREKFSDYGKVGGYLLARDLGLPVGNSMHAVQNLNDLEEITKALDHNLFSCRPDAPIGMGNLLPRGRDLNVEEIPKFLNSVQGKCAEAILLLSLSPSLETLGYHVPRYGVSGGVMIVVEKGFRVDFEYVGKGFDVGELTRGLEVHSSISIPWGHIDDKPMDIWRHLGQNIYGRKYEISDKDYTSSRTRRIHALRENLDENSPNIEGAIPEETPHLPSRLFREVFDKHIPGALYSNNPRLGKTYGIMMNFYDEKPYVFEIWQPKRSNNTSHA